MNIHEKKSDVKATFLTKQPIFVLLYKDAYFNINDLNHSLPSIVKSLLQDLENRFPEDIPNGLQPIRGIDYQIDFILVQQFQTDLHINVTLRKQKNFKIG